MSLSDKERPFGGEYLLNESTKDFFISFYNAFNMANMQDLRNHYLFGFQEETQKYYKDCPWPEPAAIADLCDNNSFFQMLYKEMTTVHMHTIHKATAAVRVEAFNHYLEMFDFILQWGNEMPYQLPLEWLYEIISEFVYQFQSFWTDRHNAPGDAEVIAANPDAWNPGQVLYLLSELQTCSVIKEAIVADREGRPLPDVPNQILHMLGYFAMVGETRIQLMLGDYRAAVKALDVIDLSQTGLFSRVLKCHVMLFYCAGFAYMMLHRFTDATRTFAKMVVFLQRMVKQSGGIKSFLKDVQKKHDQMLALCAIMKSVSIEFRVDALVEKNLRDLLTRKNGWDTRVERGDPTVFQELFKFGAPKFIIPFCSEEDKQGANKGDPTKAHLQQVTPFLNEVNQRKDISEAAFYLKLYTTVTIEKLASLLQYEKDMMVSHLLFLKHKSMDTVWKSGNPLSGKTKSMGDVHFFIKGESVHITNEDRLVGKGDSHIGRYFIEHSLKFDTVTSFD